MMRRAAVTRKGFLRKSKRKSSETWTKTPNPVKRRRN